MLQATGTVYLWLVVKAMSKQVVNTISSIVIAHNDKIISFVNSIYYAVTKIVSLGM